MPLCVANSKRRASLGKKNTKMWTTCVNYTRMWIFFPSLLKFSTYLFRGVYQIIMKITRRWVFFLCVQTHPQLRHLYVVLLKHNAWYMKILIYFDGIRKRRKKLKFKKLRGQSVLGHKNDSDFLTIVFHFQNLCNFLSFSLSKHDTDATSISI
jgi:hypothetical protein